MCTICAEINAAIVGADFDCFAGTNVAGVEGVDVINKSPVLPIMQPPPSPIEPKPPDEHEHHSNILRKLHIFLKARWPPPLNILLLLCAHPIDWDLSFELQWRKSMWPTWSLGALNPPMRVEEVPHLAPPGSALSPFISLLFDL